jgi:dTDP-glucose 4,6-dehydratase
MGKLMWSKFSIKSKRSDSLFSRTFWDYFIWFLSINIATILRYDGNFSSEKFIESFKISLVVALIYISLNFKLSLYSNRYQNGSIDEFIVIFFSILLATIIMFFIRLVFIFPNLPRSVPLISGLLVIVITLAFRLSKRPNIYKIYLKKNTGERSLIYGAGITGKQLVEKMLESKIQFNPIGFLDDDTSKSDSRILGRNVLGTIRDLDSIVKKYKPDVLFISFFNISSSSLNSIEEQCKLLKIKLKIVPNIFELDSTPVKLSQIRDVSEEDLIGRNALKFDEEDISNFFNEKSVLITGAGGSIGSEIVKQIYRYKPKIVYMLDRDENALHSLELELKKPLLEKGALILADIRDSNTVDQIFNKLKPEVVFHTAALKHVNFLQKFPSEAYKTNILGTKNLLIAAKLNGTTNFVNISTDKAAEPISVLGKSKLITEKMVAGFGLDSKNSKSKFLSVRFGNVIGSNGSFIKTFQHQINNGGPVSVTHPDVSRYFMTLTEAVHLVLKASVIGNSGETLVLEMGEPVKIDFIAKRMIERSGRKVEIIYTGLKSGEKLSEVLFNSSEVVEISNSNFIMRTRVEPMPLREVPANLSE